MTNTKFAVVTKSVGAVLLASLVIEASVYFVRWCTRIALRHVQGTRSGAKSEGDGKHELLFFPDDRPACKAHYTERQGCHDPRCRFSHEDTSFTKLMRRLNSARVSVDLCVFCFTSPELAEAVTALYGRGVKVRVITDNEQVDAANSQVGRFRAHGMQVRHDWTSYLMHHKFAILDGHCLINGSFNWTRQAITGNNENVLITTDSSLVRPFVEEFEKLWLQFDPTKQSTK